MCVYFITNPMRRKPIGKRHVTLASAKRAVHRAANRLGHAHIEHWRDGRIYTAFAGELVGLEKPATDASLR